MIKDATHEDYEISKRAGNYLRVLRIQRNMTLEGLAIRANTTNQHVSNHEKGKRQMTIDWLKRYSKALSCHILEITDGPNASLPKNAMEEEMLSLFMQLDEADQNRIIGNLEAKIDDKNTT